MSGYTSQWFRLHAEGARRSAERILPLVLTHVPVTSALDVGCGPGEWLAVLQAHGVEDVIGVDGDYVDRALLELATERFVALDLNEGFDLGRTFDLAISLEVAEHLRVEAADDFVASLVRHAPVILFSAATPGQGGTNHYNEQWPDYWAERFRLHNYVAVDAIRPKVWTDEAVETYYVENIILYIRKDVVPEALESDVVDDLGSLSIVHPKRFEWVHWLSQRPRPSRSRMFVEALIGYAATERLRGFLRKAR